jgi:hypothetical protein
MFSLEREREREREESEREREEETRRCLKSGLTEVGQGRAERNKRAHARS